MSNSDAKHIDDPHVAARSAALRFVGTLLAAGLLVVAVYSWMTGPATRAGLQIITAGAAAVVGAFLGFLFGIPKMLQQSTPSPADGEPRTETGLEYQSNTNLEQISDWLTKILVGVGLTQLHRVGAVLQSIAEAIAPGAADDGRGFIMASLVYFATTAFLLGYLWTRLVYSHILVASESAIFRTVRILRGQLKEAISVAAGTAAAAARGVGKAPALVGARFADGMTLDDVPEGMEIRLPPVVDEGDPNKGRFGGKSAANGRELRAKVTKQPDSDEWFLVRLEVVATDGRPLDGDVWFYLHPTFIHPVDRVAPIGATAALEVISYGAFTAGVIADRGATLLELDLANLEWAPKTFRSS